MSYKITNLGVIVISGFSQKVSDRTGMGELYCKLRKYASPTHYVMHRAWKGNFKELAAILDRDRTDEFKLVVIAYSWGCGHGVQELAKHLGRFGIRINLLILIDPVLKRPGWALSPRQAWALTRFGRFKVPPNVDQVWSCRQLNHTPFGRKLRLASKRTKVLGEMVFGSRSNIYKYTNNPGPGDVHELFTNDEIGHNDMDDQPRIQEKALTLIAEFIGE